MFEQLFATWNAPGKTPLTTVAALRHAAPSQWRSGCHCEVPTGKLCGMHPLRSRVTLLRCVIVVAAGALLAACGAGDPNPIVEPGGGNGANLRLERVVFTQVVQNDAGTLPLIAGVSAAAKVLITRSRESVAEVPVVLRLFRGGVIVHTDTTRTGGVLSAVRSLATASAEFLVPASLVNSDVSWQVVIDPRQTQPDSTRTDNQLPAAAPELLVTVAVPPLRVRMVPVILASHGDVSGAVTEIQAELYVRLARQIFPARAIIVTLGAPVVTRASFGTLPVGGERGFWGAVLADVDRARVSSATPEEYWYGVVSLPSGYVGFAHAGYGYIPPSPTDAGPSTRTGAGLGLSDGVSTTLTQETFAHELGHNFGRRHAPGCNAVAPIDTLYGGVAGSISSLGHDVWSWANNFSLGATSVSSGTGDVMSYCAPKWIGPYTWRGVLEWRLSSTVASHVTRQRTLPVSLP